MSVARSNVEYTTRALGGLGTECATTKLERVHRCEFLFY